MYRGPTLEDAEDKFNALFQRLPIFIGIVRAWYNVRDLQRISDVLIFNPSWSLTHLVAHFNLTEHIMHPKIIDNIDYPDHTNQMTPLQLAIKSGNIDMVKVLLPLCNVEHLDITSSSVFHYAAETTKEMINLLTTKSTKNLNHCNADGYTPLHLACLKDKPDCVKALLLAGADVNISARDLCNSSNHIYKSAATQQQSSVQTPKSMMKP